LKQLPQEYEYETDARSLLQYFGFIIIIVIIIIDKYNNSNYLRSVG
jgi:hypothetical protein